MSKEPKFITAKNDRRIAYHKSEGKEPTVIFCGGYMSDMEGTKATFLEEVCGELGLSYIRFDYSGHGSSSEEFIDGTIASWRDDTLAVIDQLSEGPLIIIGSSMGGWIGLLVSLARKERVRAFIGIAAAPDFTRELMWDKYSPGIREILKRDGVYLEPSEYSDEPYKVSYGLIQDGENHILLNGAIELKCPVRLFHGLKDKDVPSETSARIADKLLSEDVIISYSKSGDHSLSSPADLERLRRALAELS
tara:strand:- start:42152 stop:42898 length:747 start_codon:yes stop_codon:yes gene_type:complete